MDLNYNFLNITILFGAIQGFVLCVSIYNRKELNKAAVFMFVLFLFSLAFLNMMYAFLDLNLFQYYRPLHLFPFPYKWLIGPAFYFYIKNQFVDRNEKPFHKKEWFLFIPALLYGCVRLYWFHISATENNYRITKVIVDSNYFRIQEVVYLLYTILLGILAFMFLIKMKRAVSNQPKAIKSIGWLKGFIILFISIHIIGFFLFSIDLIIHKGQETFLFLYPSLIINVAFIYWIGIIGFTKPKHLFNAFKIENTSKKDTIKKEIAEKLNIAINMNEVYKNPNLTLEQLALTIEISPRELSKHINEIQQMNFSEFLNSHRIEKVKELLTSPDSKKYKFLTLAEDAGFSSKSSFNAIFKKMVGVSPSAYKKQHLHKK
jgi:AraC-like DNA-binding protein